MVAVVEIATDTKSAGVALAYSKVEGGFLPTVKRNLIVDGGVGVRMSLTYL